MSDATRETVHKPVYTCAEMSPDRSLDEGFDGA